MDFDKEEGLASTKPKLRGVDLQLVETTWRNSRNSDDSNPGNNVGNCHGNFFCFMGIHEEEFISGSCGQILRSG